MKINNIIIFVLAFTVSTITHAKVRDLYVAANEMGTINLKMGQSTVLRFHEKPKKVVIGNQNYFNVEFIDNDVTIQPLGTAKTNLFVYGEYNTYGLILSVDSDNFYDDLVIVKRGWKPAADTKKKVSPKNVTPKFSFKEKLGNDLIVISNNLQFHDSLKLYILDIEFKNEKGILINKKDIGIETSIGNKKFGDTKVVFNQQEDSSNLGVRIFMKIPSKKNFSLVVNYQKFKIKHIIEEKYL